MAELPPLKTLLQELIETLSVSSTSPQWDTGNRPVIDKLAQWLATLGFDIEILPLEGCDNKANLIATLGAGPGGLVLAGHTDTVPFNESRWQSDPLSLSERDNRWYGLGATDMKGFFPIIIEAAKSLADQTLQQPLIILATADEESSMEGARQLAQSQRVQGRVAIIGEPTGLKPIRMHKGMMMEALTIEGRAGHSSNPLLGNSALEAMHTVMADLLSFRQQMQAQYRNPLFAVDVPTMNLGCIHGGDNPNRICGQCELHFDLRPLPGMDIETLRQELQQRLTPLADRLGVNISLRSLMPGVAPFEQDAASDIVQMAERLTGYSAESVAYATEGPLLQQMGMETIVMGPGSIDQAHQPDEFLALEQIKPAVDLFQRLMAHYCL